MQHKLAEAFRSKITLIETSRQKYEDLHKDGHLCKKDLIEIYEGLFIKLTTSFEDYLEDLFIRILLNKTSYPKRRVKSRITLSSVLVMRDVLFQGKDYIDWLPIENTIKRSKYYLRGGRPFTEIDPNDINKLQQAHWTRNAIAHSSDYSQEKFRKNVIANLNLNPRERTPAGYLMSVFRIAPITTRFQLILGDFARISKTLE